MAVVRSMPTFADQAEPMQEMNTTPLIDVLLVLLIMFIITIPVQSHRVPIDLPGDKPTLPIERLKNLVALDADGQAYWNGVGLSDAALQRQLVAVAAMPDQPDIQFAPDSEAPYERVDQLLASMRQSGVERLGFVGNERYRQF